jgi:hypothetical protein
MYYLPLNGISVMGQCAQDAVTRDLVRQHKGNMGKQKKVEKRILARIVVCSPAGIRIEYLSNTGSYRYR